MNFKYDLGVTLRSLIHGFEGVAMARSEEITGCNVYMVQPRCPADGKMPDAFWLSETALVQADTEKVVLVDYSPQDFIFELGVTARSVVHGLEGIVTARAEFLGNTNRYRVHPEGVTTEGKLKHDYWIDEHALVQTSQAKIELPPMRKAGGPAPLAAGYR